MLTRHGHPSAAGSAFGPPSPTFSSESVSYNSSSSSGSGSGSGSGTASGRSRSGSAAAASDQPGVHHHHQHQHHHQHHHQSHSYQQQQQQQQQHQQQHLLSQRQRVLTSPPSSSSSSASPSPPSSPSWQSPTTFSTNTNNSNNNGRQEDGKRRALASSAANNNSASSSSAASSVSSATVARQGLRWMADVFRTASQLFWDFGVPRPVPQPHVKRKTLVLDLDETLIHSTLEPGGPRVHDMQIDVHIEKLVYVFYVYKRPYVDLFLKQTSHWYDLVIFTASLHQYGHPVIDSLDLGRGLFRHRLFRESCVQENGNFMKDLTLVEPDLARVCLIDNSPGAYAIQPENGIPIETWYSDPKDQALLDLLPFLNALRFTNDVRSILSIRLP